MLRINVTTFEEEQDNLQHIEDMALELHQTARSAVEQYEVWIRCAEKRDIIDRVNTTTSFIAPAFMVLRDALHKNLVLTILKLFDRNGKTASLVTTINFIAEKGLAQNLGNANQIPNPEQHLENIRIKLKEVMGMPEFNSIRVLRNTVIAHNDFAKPAHGAKYGDERKVLEVGLECVVAVRLLVEGTNADYADWKEIFAREANKFWEHLARN